jgi:hypothetical protein
LTRSQSNLEHHTPIYQLERQQIKFDAKELLQRFLVEIVAYTIRDPRRPDFDKLNAALTKPWQVSRDKYRTILSREEKNVLLHLAQSIKSMMRQPTACSSHHYMDVLDAVIQPAQALHIDPGYALEIIAGYADHQCNMRNPWKARHSQVSRLNIRPRKTSQAWRDLKATLETFALLILIISPNDVVQCHLGAVLEKRQSKCGFEKIDVGTGFLILDSGYDQLATQLARLEDQQPSMPSA